MSITDGTPGNGGAEATHGELSVVPVLTKDPGMMRDMLLAQIDVTATDITRALKATTDGGRINDRSDRLFRGRARRDDIEFMQRRVAELNECMDLLGQVGWRKQKGER